MSPGRTTPLTLNRRKFVVHPHLLRSAEQKIAVRQNRGDDRRDRNLDLLGSGDIALALVGRSGGELVGRRFRCISGPSGLDTRGSADARSGDVLLPNVAWSLIAILTVTMSPTFEARCCR